MQKHDALDNFTPKINGTASGFIDKQKL